MTFSESAGRLHKMINQAIEDHRLTRAEMDQIINLTTDDDHIDSQEQALLTQLRELIENGVVKIVP